MPSERVYASSAEEVKFVSIQKRNKVAKYVAPNVPMEKSRPNVSNVRAVNYANMKKTSTVVVYVVMDWGIASTRH